MEFGLEKLSHFGFEIRALFSQREEKLVPVLGMETVLSGGNAGERRTGSAVGGEGERRGMSSRARRWRRPGGEGQPGPSSLGRGRPGGCRAKLFGFQFVRALGQSHCLFKPAANICLVFPAPWGVEAGAVKGSPAFWDHPVLDASVSAVIY